MTYKEANRRFNRSLWLFAAFSVCSGCWLAAAGLGTLRGWESVTPLWIGATVMGLLALVAYYSARSRAKMRNEIGRAWQENIETFSLFIFIVSHELRKDELSILMHLWGHHHEKRATRDWNAYDIENAAETYREGASVFQHVLVRMCGRGHIEFSPKHFHHLVIGEGLWDTVKRRYPLDDFSIKRAEELDTARRAAQELAS